MTHWLLGPALSPGGRYVCIACRLRSLQARRQQHAVPRSLSTTEQDALAIKTGEWPVKSQDEEGKNSSVLRYDGGGTLEISRSKSTVKNATREAEPGQPSVEARNLQRLLHEKFVAQRRKDAVFTRSPEKDLRRDNSGSNDATKKAREVNTAELPDRKSESSDGKRSVTKDAIESSDRPYRSLREQKVSRQSLKTLSKSRKGERREKTKAMEEPNKAQIDKKARVRKPKSKSTKKERPHKEAAEAATTGTLVTTKAGEKHKGKTVSGASPLQSPDVNGMKTVMGGPNETELGGPGVIEQLKGYFRGLRETLAGKESANKDTSSPVQHELVQQTLLSPKRQRRKGRRAAKLKESKKDTSTPSTVGNGTPTVIREISLKGRKGIRETKALVRRLKTSGRETKAFVGRLKTSGREKKALVRKLHMTFVRKLISKGDGSENVSNVRRIKIEPGRAELISSTPAADKEPAKAEGQSKSRRSRPNRTKDIQTIDAGDLEITALDLKQPPVPRLSYGLERVLFNPGVYHLQDPRSRVYNFDPYLQSIMPVKEFNFNALKEYITSSRDIALQDLAASYKKRYVGSSSSMTGVLAHFHFLLSQWRSINTKMLSRGFPEEHITKFTELQRIPTAVFLKWRNGSYAIDADKEFASANILMLLGKSMEKLLTLDTEDFERYRKSSSNKVPEEERKAPEAYHYSTMGDFIMRSQLDAYDPRLPGTGMFDLKTRAVVSVRMEASNFEEGSGYQIKSRQGAWESFEREYFDMIRSAFLKYSLQVRMGRMDGIFVAFHNTDRIFGFQYISLSEMDSTLHGQWDTNLGDQEFKFSVALLNEVLDRATKKYPNTSLRLHFETREAQTNFMYIFAEPVTEEQIIAIQTARDAEVQALEKELYGNDSDGDESREDQGWENLQANVEESMDEDIRDPNHEDGKQDLNPVPTGLEHTTGEMVPQRVVSPDGAVASGEIGAVDDIVEPEKSGDSMTILTTKTGVDGTARIRSTDSYHPEGSNDALRRPPEESAGDSQHNGQSDGEEQITEGASLTADKTSLGQSPADNAQTTTTTTTTSGKDVLAFTLTVRNEVNGKYVLRPLDLGLRDKWSIEYSLDEVPNPERARSLYQACQTRRRKKHDGILDVREEDEQVDSYIRRLRQMSRAGAKWRKNQDEKDTALPIKVL